jgi:transcriptional regulator with XRE-family HTH domain
MGESFDGNRMRLLRKAASLRHRDLGMLCKRDARTIMALESGSLVPSRQLAERIAEIFGVGLAALYGGDGTRPLAEQIDPRPAEIVEELTPLEDHLLTVLRRLDESKQLEVLNCAYKLSSAESDEPAAEAI